MAKYSKNSDTECVSHVADTTHFDGKDSTDKGVGIRTLATEGKASQHVRVGVGVLVKDPTNPQKVTSRMYFVHNKNIIVWIKLLFSMLQ